MEQYNNDNNDEKPRIKLPLIKTNSEDRVKDLERQVTRHAIAIDKLQREIGRLKGEIDDLRRVVKL